MTGIFVGRACSTISVNGGARSIALFMSAVLSICNAKADATQVPQSVRTPAGLVDVLDAKGSDCGPNISECKVIEVNGKALASDSFASIDAVFPATGVPQLISVETATGGNACCWDYYILDVSQSSPILMKNFSFGKEVFYSETGVTFASPMDDNELGDPTVGFFRYSFGSGKPVLLRRIPKYSTVPFNQKQYPWDFLGDPSSRIPILKVVGRPYEVDPDFGTRGLIGKSAVPLLNGADHDEEKQTDD